jgi:hypothetical protein
MWLLLTLSACSWFEPVDEVAGPGGSAAPDRLDEALPEPTDNVPQPSEASRRRAACSRVFTADDANQAFGVTAEAAADCTFEGVRVAGTEMFLRWTPPTGDEVTLVLAPASCGEGDPVGELLMRDADAARAACPGAVAQVRGLAEAGRLPLGSAPAMDPPDRQNTAPDAPGPDEKTATDGPPEPTPAPPTHAMHPDGSPAPVVPPAGE